MKNNKFVFGIIISLMFLMCFLSACSTQPKYVDVAVNTNTAVLETNDSFKEQETVENATDTVPVSQETDNIQLNEVGTEISEECNNISTLYTFIEDRTELSIDLEYYEENYFDDYEGITMDESGNIVVKDENDFPVICVYTSFIDGKIHNMSATLNIQKGNQVDKYQELVQNIFKIYLNQQGISNVGQNEYVNNLFNFDLYESNIYNNLELNVFIEDCYGLGVVFDGGKDFLFEGTTYYYSIDYAI